jgi:hypothetical protein
VSAVQTRFCEVFPFAHAVLSYCVPEHVAQLAQTRLVVAVGATLSYWPVVQLVNATHELPLKYWPALQPVHSPAEGPVQLAQAALQAAHVRFWAVLPLAHAWLSY